MGSKIMNDSGLLDFSVEGMICAAAESADYEGWGTGDNILQNYSLWCLGHNFDIVGAILSMAKISWERGFDSGVIIGAFAENPNRDNRAALPIRQSSGD